MDTRASAMTDVACCLVASQRAVLIVTILRLGSLNSAQDPVVKSWSLVPTAMTTSASSAIALEHASPAIPRDPA